MQDIFNEVDDYEELKAKTLEKVTELLEESKNYQSLVEGISSMLNLEEKEQKRLLKLAHEIDKKMKNPSSRHKDNSKKKIPALLSCARYLDEYKEQANKLNDEELITLGAYTLNHIDEEYEENINFFSKNIMTAVCDKDRDISSRIGIMSVVYTFYEEAEDKTNYEEKTINYINDTPIKEIYRVEDEQFEAAMAQLERDGHRL